MIHGNGVGSNYVWALFIGGTFNFFYVEPFNLVVYWSRPLADVVNGAPLSQHTSVAGFYTLDSPNAHPYYCEGYESAEGELLTGIYTNVWGSTTYVPYPFPLSTCWKDQVLVFDSADYLSSSVTNYLGKHVLFDNQLW